MSQKSRRYLAIFLATSIPAAILAACSTGNNAVNNVVSNVTTVNLAKAQAQAGVILTAITQAATIYTSTPTANINIVAKINLSLKALQAAVTDFQSLKSGGSVLQTGEQVLKLVTDVLMFMPIDPVTKTYIILAESIIQAFLAGVTTVPVVAAPVATKLAGTYLIGEGTQAPIKIPAPRATY